MRKFLVIVVLAGLAWLFVVQKRSEPQKIAPEKAVAQASTSTSTSPRPVSEHNWMKRSLDRTNEVKRQVAQQRKEDGTR
jgi:cytoskeletal protein RodZ